MKEHWPAGAPAPDLEFTATHMSKLISTATAPVRLTCTALTAVHLRSRAQPFEASPPGRGTATVGGHSVGSGRVPSQTAHLPHPERGSVGLTRPGVESGRGAAQQGRPGSAAQGGGVATRGKRPAASRHRRVSRRCRA